MPISKASNAVLAKARSLYGRRLTPADYQALAACRTMPELADALKNRPLYAAALANVSPATARRANLELDLRESIFHRYASLCRYEMSAGETVYQYFILCCDLDEITTWLRYLDSGCPGDYLFVLPDFLEKHTQLDLYQLAKARSIDDLLRVLHGTPYGAALAPLSALSGRPGTVGVLAQAAPMLAALRHKALVALAPQAKLSAGGTQPGIREYIEWECDAEMIPYAARMKRLNLAPAAMRAQLALDCTALTHLQWDALLSAKDSAAFRAALDKTCYGRGLAAESQPHLQERFEALRFRWCRKWLRFSTDPVLVMLCYIFLAKNEVSNLNHIIEGVHYGLPAAEILPLVNGCDVA
ncbi:MAG: V-type ATPase subunit [Faecalibacterium sp.]|jgi:vacuolar-type H+-ATPase subunit C/Vma6|nr:V-type ATPase subunit [Faecalibacterium sp.]